MLPKAIEKHMAFDTISAASMFHMENIPKRYCINNKGLVWDNDACKLIYPTVNKKGIATTRLWIDDKAEDHMTFRLWLLAFSPMHSKDSLSLGAVKIDDLIADTFPKILGHMRKPFSFNHNNLSWIVPPGGVESDIPGYYSIPKFPDIVINKEQDVIWYANKLPCMKTARTSLDGSKKVIHVTIESVSKTNSDRLNVPLWKLWMLASTPWPVDDYVRKLKELNDTQGDLTEVKVMTDGWRVDRVPTMLQLPFYRHLDSFDATRRGALKKFNAKKLTKVKGWGNVYEPQLDASAHIQRAMDSIAQATDSLIKTKKTYSDGTTVGTF